MHSLLKWILLAAAVALVINLVWNFVRNTCIEAKGTYDLPIICMSKTQNRIGFVLRSEYDKASREFWKPYRTGKKQYDHGHITCRYGRYLEVPNVFVVDSGSAEFKTLTYICYCEHATFHVPYKEGAESTFQEFRAAYKHFFNKEWPADRKAWGGG